MSNGQNDFYFLGEAGKFMHPEKVRDRALALGFPSQNIEVFTRELSGNKINFEVISDMLNDLLHQGSIRPNWNEPIKERFLSLTDQKIMRK